MKIEEVRSLVRSRLESTLLQWGFELIHGSSSGFQLIHQTDSMWCKIGFSCSLGVNGLMLSPSGIGIRLNKIEEQVYPLELKYSLSPEGDSLFPLLIALLYIIT